MPLRRGDVARIDGLTVGADTGRLGKAENGLVAGGADSLGEGGRAVIAGEAVSEGHAERTDVICSRAAWRKGREIQAETELRETACAATTRASNWSKAMDLGGVMSLADAWMLKGWLMRDERVTAEIMAAVEAVIAALSNPRVEISIPPVQFPVRTEAEVAHSTPPVSKRRGWSDEAKAAASERMRARMVSRREAKASPPQPSTYRGPEGPRRPEGDGAAVASGTSNRAVIEIDDSSVEASKLDGGGQDAESWSQAKSAEPIEDSDNFPSSITVPARLDPWQSAELSPDDWPDIQKMLAAGSTREKIAGDYDIPVPTLNAFIERQMESARARRTTKEAPPGEAHAPLP